MPTYEFQCLKCEKSFSVKLPFESTEVPICPLCGGSARKIFKAPMIHFKGSGFYKTDNARSATRTSTNKPKESVNTPPTTEKPSKNSKPTAPSA